MTKIASPTAVARHFLFVRETLGPNRGAWVQFFQRFVSGQPGDSWCCFFVCLVLDICYAGKAPLIRTGSCAVLLADAKRLGFVTTTPVADDLFFYLDVDGHAHHVGIVTSAAPLVGIAGNTSADGTSSNGTGVFEHAIGGRIVFVHTP